MKHLDLEGHLEKIKDVHEHCYNNIPSKKVFFPWQRCGIFRTPTMITCLDNKRRRVWCNATNDSYYLFVHIGGKRVMLKENGWRVQNFATLNNMIDYVE